MLSLWLEPRYYNKIILVSKETDAIADPCGRVRHTVFLGARVAVMLL